MEDNENDDVLTFRHCNTVIPGHVRLLKFKLAELNEAKNSVVQSH